MLVRQRNIICDKRVRFARYKAYKERMARMYVTQRYDPVFIEPNMKEYEVQVRFGLRRYALATIEWYTLNWRFFFAQVLQMSVPIDDNDSYNDLQLDFSRKNHTFSMDNVGYITKENVDSIGNNNKFLTSYNNKILRTSVQQLLRDENFQTWRYEDNI